jgi:hypothetical protein
MISNLSFYVSTIIYYLSKDFLLAVVIYLLFIYIQCTWMEHVSNLVALCMLGVIVGV